MSSPKGPDNSDKPSGPSGRVRHDASGRAIWEWAADTGRHAIDSTSRLLKRLELPGLKLEDDAKKEAEEKLAAEEAAQAAKPQVPSFGGPSEKDPLSGSRRSFNPYDNRAPPPKRAAAKPATAPRAAQPAKPASKPGFLARLLGKR